MIIYKYVYNDEIIYIGQTQRSLEERIREHRKEVKFKPYLNAEVYYFKVNNIDELDMYERLLINKYKPILNVACNSKITINIDFNEPKWKLLIDDIVKPRLIGRPSNGPVVKRSLRVEESIDSRLVAYNRKTNIPINTIINNALDEYLE